MSAVDLGQGNPLSTALQSYSTAKVIDEKTRIDHCSRKINSQDEFRMQHLQSQSAQCIVARSCHDLQNVFCAVDLRWVQEMNDMRWVQEMNLQQITATIQKLRAHYFSCFRVSLE